jgi:hypoxanthine phosphoribosyltransferase
MTDYTPDQIRCRGELFEPLLSTDEIQHRIVELGAQLAKDFQGKKPIFIGVLNGAYIFLSDLMRYVNIPCEVDFLKLNSYGGEKVSSGEITSLKDIDADIEGRHVILVDDIVDTGLSMKYLLEKLGQREVKSLSVVTLLHKKEVTRYDIPLDYIGFEVPDVFVLGYGLDYAQEGRNLAQIYSLVAG